MFSKEMKELINDFWLEKLGGNRKISDIKVKFEMLFRDEKFREIVRKMFPEKFSGEPPKPKIKRPKKHKKVSILSKEQIREEPLR